MSQQLWNQLLEHNIVSATQPQNDLQDTPWYISAIQGIAGWIAALFLLGFFATAFEFLFDRATTTIAISAGLLCSVIAYVIIRLQKNDFFSQLALAFSMCGQFMFAFGLLYYARIENANSFLILASYQLLLAWVIPHYAHRLLTGFFGLISLIIAINFYGIHAIGSAFLAIVFSFIWLKENSWGQSRRKWEAFGYSAAMTIVFCSGYLVGRHTFLVSGIVDTSSWLFIHANTINSCFIALVFMNMVLILLKEHRVALSSKTAILSIVAAIGLVVISFKIYGISAGLLITIIGFARQRKTLMTLGGITVISFFSWYYYNLDQTLLFKSIVLIILGITILLGWWLLSIFYQQSSSIKVNRPSWQKITANKWLPLATIMLVLVSVNINIQNKQALIHSGETLLFKLAPLDPRSIMQGDYMRLRFDVAVKIREQLRLRSPNKMISNQQGHVIVEKNAQDIVSFVSLYNDQKLSNNQYLIPFKYRKYRVLFTTNAFYFQEGMAKHFEKAEYGLFKRSDDGEMLLVNLVDKDLKIL